MGRTDKMAEQVIDRNTGRVLGMLVEKRDNSYEVRDPSGEVLSYFKEEVKLQKVADPLPEILFDSEVNAPISEMRMRLSTGEAKVVRQSPLLAGVLSFSFPGLGQFYNAQWRKGAALLLICFMLPVVNFFAWIWGISDAVSEAGKINRGLLPMPKHNAGTFVALALIPLVVIISILGMVLVFMLRTGAF